MMELLNSEFLKLDGTQNSSFPSHFSSTLNSLEGLILVNKPKGILSHDLVKEFRKLTKVKLVGHAGTLDPLASGLLILLLGRGTKFSDEFRNFDKTYEVKIRFGITSDTLDKDGKILSQRNVSLKPKTIENKARFLMGEMKLPVPFFSAVKKGGKKLYELAREGKKEVIVLKEMKFYNLVILDVGSDFLKCRFSCSKGSYVRAWSHFLGQELEVGAIVEALHRTHSAPYSVEAAISWEKLKKSLLLKDKKALFLRDDFKKAFIPLSDFFPQWKVVRVFGQDKKLILDGQVSYHLNRRLIVERKKADSSGQSVGIKILDSEDGNLLALLKAEPNKGLRVKNCFRV